MRKIKRIVSGAALVATLLGCTTGGSKLATIQAEKEQLLTTIRTQRDAAREQGDKIASLENRLDQAEKELARAGSSTRISTRPASGRVGDPPAALKSEPLPWRTPGKVDASKSDAKSSDNRPANGPQLVSASSSMLALSRADSRVSYDSTSRAAKIDVPLSFDGPTAGLTAADKVQLDEVAKLLRAGDARDLKIMIAGSNSGSDRQLGTTRAQAVADYLDRHGIAHERLAVSGVNGRGSSPGGSAGGVEIYLVDSASNVAGWEAPARVRR